MKTAHVEFSFASLLTTDYFEDEGDAHRVAEWIVDRLELSRINGVSIEAVNYRPHNMYPDGYVKVNDTEGVDVDEYESLIAALNERVDELLTQTQDPNHPLNR